MVGEVPNDWNFSRLDAVSKIVRGNSAFSKMDLLESGKYVALQYGKTYKVNEINESFGSYVNQEFLKISNYRIWRYYSYFHIRNIRRFRALVFLCST